MRFSWENAANCIRTHIKINSASSLRPLGRSLRSAQKLAKLRIEVAAKRAGRDRMPSDAMGTTDGPRLLACGSFQSERPASRPGRGAIAPPLGSLAQGTRQRASVRRVSPRLGSISETCDDSLRRARGW